MGLKNSEPSTSESYEQNFDRTHVGIYEHSYQQKYESNIGLNKAITNMSCTTDQSIISNQNTLVTKENETQLEDWSDGNRNHTGTKK